MAQNHILTKTSCPSSFGRRRPFGARHRNAPWKRRQRRRLRSNARRRRLSKKRFEVPIDYAGIWKPKPPKPISKMNKRELLKDIGKFRDARMRIQGDSDFLYEISDHIIINYSTADLRKIFKAILWTKGPKEGGRNSIYIQTCKT